MQKYDVVIIGAGAAGLMCAIEAGKRQRRVLVLDHANKVGKKILMSGGGRCNFTNYHIEHDHYISANPDFCRSALKRFTQWDFIDLVHQFQIPFHEKSQGQLFCDNKSSDIVNMLLALCERYHVKIQLLTKLLRIDYINKNNFKIQAPHLSIQTPSLVIATGGLSIPTLGASPFGYQIAQQFDIPVLPTRAGLVPLTLHVEDKEKLSALSGIGLKSIVTSQRKTFCDDLLYTHRGLSGPAILQISSYWQAGEALTINLLPNQNIVELLNHAKYNTPHQLLKSVLIRLLPKNVILTFFSETTLSVTLKSLSLLEMTKIAAKLQHWTLKPNSTEGYRTAEVTLGGVNCDAISSKTMEVNNLPGLYFIGEVLDVTGWLGGYNFQWAWSSGWAAGQAVG